MNPDTLIENRTLRENETLNESLNETLNESLNETLNESASPEAFALN